MAALKHERAVFLLAGHIKMVPADAPEVKLDECLTMLQNLYKTKRAFACIDAMENIDRENCALTPDALKKKNAKAEDVIYISDFKWTKADGIVQLLVNRGDSKLSSPAFLHAHERTVRAISGEKDETIGYSCHIIINYKKLMPDGCFRVVLEKTPNVSRTIVQRFLCTLLDVSSSESGLNYIRKNKSGDKDTNYGPRIEFNPKPSASLKKDIETGRVNSVTLRERGFEYGIDPDVSIKKTQRELKLTIDYGGKAQNFFHWLQNTLQPTAKRENYDEISINIVGLPGKKQSSPKLTLDQASSTEYTYARAEVISDFKMDLEQCTSECNTELLSKMVTIARKESSWK